MSNVKNPEIGRTIDVNGIKTNLHDIGSGPSVMLIHGSGPGVTAWANWRLVMPELSKNYRVLVLLKGLPTLNAMLTAGLIMPLEY